MIKVAPVLWLLLALWPILSIIQALSIQREVKDDSTAKAVYLRHAGRGLKFTWIVLVSSLLFAAAAGQASNFMMMLFYLASSFGAGLALIIWSWHRRALRNFPDPDVEESNHDA